MWRGTIFSPEPERFMFIDVFTDYIYKCYAKFFVDVINTINKQISIIMYCIVVSVISGDCISKLPSELPMLYYTIKLKHFDFRQQSLHNVKLVLNGSLIAVDYYIFMLSYSDSLLSKLCKCEIKRNGHD